MTHIFASQPNGRFTKVLDESAQRVRFARVKGRSAMLLYVHSTGCDGAKKTAKQRGCIVTLFFDGSRVSSRCSQRPRLTVACPCWNDEGFANARHADFACVICTLSGTCSSLCC
jgi:hypothetical protein